MSLRRLGTGGFGLHLDNRAKLTIFHGMSRFLTALLIVLQVQVWGGSTGCLSPDCEPEPVKHCCGMPMEEEPLAAGCAEHGAECPCCVEGEVPADRTAEPAKQAWEAPVVHLSPLPADSLLPADAVFENIGPRHAAQRHAFPNAPPRSVLSCWIL